MWTITYMKLPIVFNSNLGPILSRFKDVRAFERKIHFFPHSTPSPAKISGVFF